MGNALLNFANGTGALVQLNQFPIILVAHCRNEVIQVGNAFKRGIVKAVLARADIVQEGLCRLAGGVAFEVCGLLS